MLTKVTHSERLGGFRLRVRFSDGSDCDDIPAAADAPTIDELMAKISAMALDLLPDNHPDGDPASLFVQITALREAKPGA